MGSRRGSGGDHVGGVLVIPEVGRGDIDDELVEHNHDRGADDNGVDDDHGGANHNVSAGHGTTDDSSAAPTTDHSRADSAAHHRGTNAAAHVGAECLLPELRRCPSGRGGAVVPGPAGVQLVARPRRRRRRLRVGL